MTKTDEKVASQPEKRKRSRSKKKGISSLKKSKTTHDDEGGPAKRTANNRKSKGKTKDASVKSSPPTAREDSWSKSKKKRMRQLKAKQTKKLASSSSSEQDSPMDKKPTNGKTKKDKWTTESLPEETTAASSIEPLKEEGSDKVLPRKVQKEIETTRDPSSSSLLQESFKARLAGSRFRILNEELYTTTSAKAFERFSQHPELYHQYHDGFRHQVDSQWPVNPVTVIVESIKTSSLPRNNNDDANGQPASKQQPIVVADFGCGDAQLAKQLLAETTSTSKKTKSALFTVHSFDLVASCDLVTACDMAHVPLPNESVHVAVFCLSLMGTNLADFIREAYRVLKPGGLLKIAEVRSRFEGSGGLHGKTKKNAGSSKTTKGQQPPKQQEQQQDLQEFIQVLDKLGFECVKTDRTNTMFVLLDLVKSKKKPNIKLSFTAKPCIYKRR